MARPVPFQDHPHLGEGARLGRAQQLLGRDPGDAVVERVRLGRGVAGVRIQDELLAGAAGAVRVRARAGDRVPAAVGVGVVPGHAVHGDRVQEVGGAGREPRPRLARQRRPRCDDHRGDLERLAVARGQDAAVRVDQSQPRVCGRAVEEAGVDRRVGCPAAAVVDEIARHRVPQRLSRPVAKRDAQGPLRARRRLAGPGEPADEMAVGQPARHAVGLAVIAVRIRVSVRKGQHPRRMRPPAACQAGPHGPADQRPPRVRERPRGRGGLSRPHRRGVVEAREQDAGAGDDRQRQRREEGRRRPVRGARRDGGVLRAGHTGRVGHPGVRSPDDWISPLNDVPWSRKDLAVRAARAACLGRNILSREADRPKAAQVPFDVGPGRVRCRIQAGSVSNRDSSDVGLSPLAGVGVTCDAAPRDDTT